MADEIKTAAVTTGTPDINLVPAGGTAAMPATDSGSSASAPTTSTVASTAKSLGGQAAEQVRSLAGTGKAKATGVLGDFARMLDDAAAQVDDKLGAQFGGYARQASGAVQSVADGLDGKEIEEMIEDVRAFVQKSPGIAVGAAAALGFVLARVVHAGIANRA